ncbi:hypothetical protein AAFF_G00097630 [Aldrovandia affinis]|uniref:Uncharacterized protein n=1 Tax=Aldrovandia affinis TaxID=143900 RepID=A0AAD7RVD7_9TELE|nr:hypothetical protein AAFF_G00097630 [Aldrovandia affinis]
MDTFDGDEADKDSQETVEQGLTNPAEPEENYTMEAEQSTASPDIDQPAAQSEIQNEDADANSSDILYDSDSDESMEEDASEQLESPSAYTLPESEQAAQEEGSDIIWQASPNVKLEPIPEEASDGLDLDTANTRLRTALTEERQKHMDARMEYHMIRRQLRKTVNQYRTEVEKGEMIETTNRSLELNVTELLNDRKQLEEDFDIAQSLLIRERSDRLHEQMEIEEETRKNLSQISDANLQLSEASDREKVLLLKNCTLREEMADLKMELEQVCRRRQEEEEQIAEKRDAQAEKLMNMERDLELNEEAFAKTVSQFNVQLSALRAKLETSSKMATHLSELEKENEGLCNQMEAEKNKAIIISQLKEAVDIKLEAEIKRNVEVDRVASKLRTQVKTIKKKLLDKHSCEMHNSQVETERVTSKLEAEVNKLSLQLEKELLKYCRLEMENGKLEEQLIKRFERVKRKKKTMAEEVTSLRRQLEACRLEQILAGKDRKEVEERANREMRKRIEEVSHFYRAQVTSQESLERVKATNEAGLRTQLEQRNRDLENELDRARTSQQDSITERDSAKAEAQYYRELHNEELRLRKNLEAKLERMNERMEEASNRHQRNIHMLTSSIINGSDTNLYSDS